MEWYEIKLNNNRVSTFPERSIPGHEGVFNKQSNDRSIASDYIGGIINGGAWGWLTRQHTDEATLLICQLDNGFRIASYTFLRDCVRCSIRCVQELFPSNVGRRVLLAVCIDAVPGGSHLAIYTPTNSQVLRYIELSPLGLNVISMTFLEKRLCAKTLLSQYDGCLAMGTDVGTVLLMDVNANEVITNGSANIAVSDSEVPRSDVTCISVQDDQAVYRFEGTLEKCRQTDGHLALEVDMPSAERIGVCSLLPLELISGFAVGMQNGYIYTYDLRSLRLVAQVRTPADQSPSAVVGLCCIEPPDDPQPCFYICSVHNAGDRLMASLHSFNYRRAAQTAENGEFDLRDFQGATTRIRMALDHGVCSLMSCGTVSTLALSGEYGTVLTAISWHSHKDHRNKLVLFDINQWYKEEMPGHPRDDERNNCLCGFVFGGQSVGLSMQLDARSIIPFVSLQRHDDYYYPKALSFDCFLMTINGYRHCEYTGIQRSFLNSLFYNKAKLFLNPENYIMDIVQLKLLPQFHEFDQHMSLSRREMYELILSLGLEQDRLWLLNECAKNCMDGSFLCNMVSSTKLTLSVLTDWIVKRASQIKARCSELCQGIFDYGGYALDERERKEFKELNGQLSRMRDLQSFVVRLGKPRLGHELVEDLANTERILSVLYEYHRMLYWFIDQAILPESSEHREQPLQLLKREYAERRARLRQDKLKLYADQQLQHYGFQTVLQQQHFEDGNYPPQTLQSVMRLMLLPDIKLEHKHELMLYLLHDMDEIFVEGRKKPLYANFAMAFAIAQPLVKCARSFWFLDKGDHEQAIEVLFRGRLGHSSYTEWQTKHLIETLLAHNANQEAMQVVHLPPGFVSSELKLQVLLANNNIPEAFHHARGYMDSEGRPLLERFFRHCIVNGKFMVLATLCLREHEEQLVYRQLRHCKTRATDCVQLILLLKRCKYIEAVSFMDEVAAERDQDPNDDTSGILSAYRTTMAPVTQSLAGTYFRIRDKLNRDQLRNAAPEPFSCQLAKQSANGRVDNIFQSSALSAHWATRYTNEQQPRTLNSHNMPFLRNAALSVKEAPQLRRHVRPTQFQYVEKRRLDGHQANCSRDAPAQPSKRRRLAAGESSETSYVMRTRELAQHGMEIEVEQAPSLQKEYRVSELLEPPNYLLCKQTLQQSANATEHQRPTILKHRRSRRQSLVQPLVAPRKSFGFLPPMPQLKNLTQVETEQDVEMMDPDEEEVEVEAEDEEEEEADEIFVEIEQQSTSPHPEQAEQRQEQEHDQEPNDSGSDVDAEFLSPMASANTSYVSFADANREQRPLVAPPTGPQPRSSLLLARSEQESSGFGSFATVQTGQTTGSLQLNEFVPPVCSSKMCEMTSARVISSSTSTHYVKISERTTICGDIDDTSVATSPPAWSMPPTSALPPAATQPQTLQMLDTTLGMSSYDITALEPVAVQEPLPETEPLPEREPVSDLHITLGSEARTKSVATHTDESGGMAYIDLDDEDEEEEELEVGVEDVGPPQRTEVQLDDVDVEMDDAEERSSPSSNEPPSTLNYNRVSPSYSVSSELSDISSPLATRQDAPVYSIVVESTNSISDSRSPTSHTPTSFLPSDTNVSQNSSPRAAHGVAADGSNRSLYRANSLETVDDLDTTKGSLEEDDDDVDEEDECVIALDGTEVRGYVARPEPVAACNSAELFAFKPQDENEPQADQVPCPSLGATANSDSVQAYTINLDSADSAEVPASLPPASSLMASSTDAPSKDPPASIAVIEERELQAVEPEPEAAIEEREHDVQVSMEVSEQDVQVSTDEPEPTVETPVKATERLVEATPVVAAVAEQSINLDSDVDSSPSLLMLSDKEEGEGEPETLKATEVDAQQQVEDDVQEEEEEEMESLNVSLPTIKEDSQHPVARAKRNRRTVDSTSPVPGRRIRLRSDDRPPSVASNRSTPSPVVVRRRRLRSGSNSTVGEDSHTPEPGALRAAETRTATPPVKEIRRRLRSEDSVGTSRVTRGGSMPPVSSVPAATLKRRQKSLARPLEAIDESSEAPTTPRTRSRAQQLLNSSAMGSQGSVAGGGNDSDSGTPHRKLRSNSEPPVSTAVLLQGKAGRRPRKSGVDEEEKSEPSPVEPRKLRSRRSTTETPTELASTASSTSVPSVSEASVPPKKRGRAKK